ncbi:MAG: Endoglucanase [Promethearchaeota archaeon]|nr:MAG: Endoglucanase [Candidatus Lokiarchaeota archaeon]
MSFEEDFTLLKKLTEIQSCSGNETKIREFIRQMVQNKCDKIETDYLGNLICYFNKIRNIPTNAEKKPFKVLLDAHMDEIGLIVRIIDKNGFIRFGNVGGQNPRILPGQKVTIHSSSGENIIGIIGEKAIHLLEKQEREKASKIDELFIDIGMDNGEEVKKYISVGDYITLEQECTAFKGKKRIFSKAFDDRAGCFILIKLIDDLFAIKEKLKVELIFQFAAQEEIGVRGATVGTYHTNPEMGIVLEVTHAIDYPGLNNNKFYECGLGAGVAIAVGPNLYPRLTKLLIETAKEEEIPFILKPEPRTTANDARAIQITRAGIPCACISVPLRYMHTNIETIEYQDLIYTIKLLKVFLLKNLKEILLKK